MTKLHVLFGLAICISSTAFAWAGDEVKIERSIRMEPVDQAREPRYCLLMLGREAKTRIWLVFDSVPDPLRPGNDKNYLYVDRNGNGDLTEPGKQVEAVIHKQQILVTFGKGFY